VTHTTSLVNCKGKVLAIDIDGTICTEERTFERPLATPLPGAIEALKKLKRNGNTLILWTGRGWEQYRVTKDWLEKYDCPYDQILMGKPVVDMFIDDRALQFRGWHQIEI